MSLIFSSLCPSNFYVETVSCIFVDCASFDIEASCAPCTKSEELLRHMSDQASILMSEFFAWGVRFRVEIHGPNALFFFSSPEPSGSQGELIGWP